MGEPPPEPMAPLAGLGAALDAVRPRLQAAHFGHKSVAESMRKELQARRERQLEKARQLAEQLKSQPQEQLWPAVAAQLRRERLQRLGRLRRPHALGDEDCLQEQQQQRQGSGSDGQPPRDAEAAGAGLLGDRVPAVTFSMSRSPASPAGRAARYSRDPGPGHYEPSLADGAISRIARSPAALFGTARRTVVPRPGGGADDSDGGGSPTRHATSAAAEVAWLTRDPLAALDYTLRRVPAAVISPAPPPSETVQDGRQSEEGGLEMLDVRFTLVEPRIRGAPLMRAPPPAAVSIHDEDAGGVPLERLPADPWAIDTAIRPRRPAWGFESLGHSELAQRPMGRHLLDLRPVYDLVERRVQGAPDFSRTPERNAGERERARQLRRLPGAGDYDVEMAWAYLCKRAPQVLMRVAAPRWAPDTPQDANRDSASGLADADDADAEHGQRRQALLELSQALDYIRPRPPAWSFAPLVRVVRRDVLGAPDGGQRGFGPLLSFDVRISLVRRRLPGALPFGVGPARQGLLDPRLLAAARHLAPGTYEVELAWRAAQPKPRATDFARGTGHVLDADEPPPPDDGGELPYGARLQLEVAAAKDAVLPRRDRGPVPAMATALGRGEGGAVAADPAYAAPTAHLPLPDPGLDLPVRPRTRAVVFEGTPGHAPLVAEPSTHTAMRGPGAYFPGGAEQALAAVGLAARVVDFGRGPERGLLDADKPTSDEVLEGNRLVLSPHTALDYVRPRAPAAVIPTANDPEHPNDLPYFHALYDVEPGLDLVLPRAPGGPELGARPGRDPPLAWPAGLDPKPAPYGRMAGMLGPDDVPLNALAGFRRAPGAADFATMRPRTPPGKVDHDGQRLDLDAGAAADRLRRQAPRPPNLALGQGHGDPLGGVRDPDWDLTAWLDYKPKLDAVRPHLVAPLAVPLGRHIGRAQALRADPRVGENATGDIDGGVYRVRHRLVWRSAPAIDFGRAASPPRSGLPPGALPADPDAGNVLMLHPREPQGWQPPLHPGRPWRQPLGRGEGRWERPGADPAYRFLAAVGDEGGALMLRHSADDLAALRRRATAANAPATAWGWMTSRRDAQVLQPDPAVPPPRRLPEPALPRVGTLLVQQLPPRGAELEVLKANPPNDPRVVALRRRDRVLARMKERIMKQRAAVAGV
ncbi:hypothetical protein GPECTOR_89g502 [Gonium pectorale]|uniref:Uncharacterized protein n=1 Tax=Gonium pectorale TaxID=33097 RepID=A0A150G0V5_GONPE|nr:hypothetical protein GPECTOR_89g502 [Gonium pectorale]|eukprot:KXZ43482.1 hypothetical protein GPECTOR_89g502 [Gonium pectorale]